MPRYRLRTLLIVLAIAPPALAGLWIAFPLAAYVPDSVLPVFYVLLFASIAVAAWSVVLLMRLSAGRRHGKAS